MKKVYYIVILILFFILAGEIFIVFDRNQKVSKNNKEEKITLELLNELQDKIPHRYYNVYKTSKEELSNISKANIYGEVVTRLDFQPTTEKYFYPQGNYYLENCEVASIDEFQNNIQKMYHLDFEPNETKDNYLGYYKENGYYYLNNTLVSIKGFNDIENEIINSIIDYEVKDDYIIITEKVSFYNTLSYYQSYNFNEKTNKYVLLNMYNQKYYFSAKKELKKYFEENYDEFPTYKSTFKKIDDSYYWYNTEKTENNLDYNSDLWISSADDTPKDLPSSYNKGKNYYLSDMKIPFINIKSNDAKKTNEEISTLYEEVLNNYKEHIDKILPWFITIDYEYFTHDQIGSVIITSVSGGSDISHPHYLTYNFNLNNGNLLTYQEVYRLLGYTSDEIDQKIQNEITVIIKEELKKDPLTDTGDGAYYPDGTNFETYNNESIDNYRNSLKDNSIRYFIDNDKRLNVIVTLSVPMGTGVFDTIIKIY